MYIALGSIKKYHFGKVQWNSLAIEILLHQTFRQLTAAFVSGMTTRSVCAVKYKCVTVRDE